LLNAHSEGSWYPGRLQKVDLKAKTATIVYDDDGNIEASVPFSEIRRRSSSKSSSSSTSTSVRIADTLPKPLAGLIDDDSDVRSKLRPTVIVHSEEDAGEGAIVINGADNKLAAGAGLRALRYLKK